MFALVLGVLRARTAQTATVLLLTVLAAAAATASPWYMLASQRRAAEAEVAAAPAAQRMLSVRRITDTGGDPAAALTNFRSTVTRLMPVHGSNPVLGMTYSLTAVAAQTGHDMAVAYRDDYCAHLRITGSCPTDAGQAVISTYSADVLGLTVDDELELRERPDSVPVRLRIVGRYELDEPNGEYWADPFFSRSGGGSGDSGSGGVALDPAFVSLSTFALPQLPQAAFAYDMPMPDGLILGDNGYDLASAMRQLDYSLGAVGLHLVTPTSGLVRLVEDDRATIALGVLVGTAQVLLLCWFALGLAGRYTARQRRHDVALLKLRGTTRPGIIRLALGQHLLPMALGLALGAIAGSAFAWSLADAVTGQVRLAVALSALVAGIAFLGGVIVLALTEAAALRSPVARLLRQVPPARRGWRSDVVDLLFVIAAIAGVYQARTGGVGGAGLALAAPTLAALAVALLFARLLGYLTNRVGGRALRAGRLRLALSALQISRQPGTDRVFALLAVAVAVLGTAASGWVAGSVARVDSTTAELGAARVLTVRASNRTALLYAVHQADPDGQQAMAAVVDLGASPPLLALDTQRLAAVAKWRPDYGPVTLLSDALANGAANAGRALPAVTGSGLTLTARNDSDQPVGLLAQLENEATGAAVPVLLGPVPPGQHDVSAPVRGCAAAPGCRLLRLELVTSPGPGAPPPPGGDDQPGAGGLPGPAPDGSSLTVSGLVQQNPPAAILDAASLSDSRRWRANTSGLGLTVVSRDGALSLTVPARDPTSRTVLSAPDNRAFVVDTPLPVPVVLAGALPRNWLLDDAMLDPFGGGSVPVRVVGTSAVLPVLGRAGILMDLDSAHRVLGSAGTGGTFQVWLADGAPSFVVDRLRAAGLTVLADDSLAARQSRLAERGPAVAALFQLLAAGVGLLLAAAGLSVAATVDRTAHAEDLRALRMQGLTRRAAAAVRYAGYASVIVTGVLAGLIASTVARFLVGVPASLGDQIGEESVRPWVLAAVGLVSLAVLGLVWWVSMARRRSGELGGMTR